MKLIDALHWRYAVKQFSAKKVPNDKLKELLNYTCLSASSYGLQPYKIIVVDSAVIRERLLPFSYGQNKILNSSHLIIFAAHTQVGDVTVDRYIAKYASINNLPLEQLSKFSAFIKSDLNNKTLLQKQEWAHQQAYIALGNFLTCAAMMEIDSCPMTGFDAKGYDEVLALEKQGLTTSIICPVGYRHKNDNYATSPKVRFDYDEMIMAL